MFEISFKCFVFILDVKGIRDKVTPAIAKQNQKKLLKELWFTNYPRMKGGPKGSSGFEHVFCKEVIHKVFCCFFFVAKNV